MIFTLHTGPQQMRAEIHSYPNKVEIKNVDDLIEATRTDHTPGDFGGNRRDFKNFLGADCILGDIDNSGRIEEYWIDLETVKEVFKDYAFAAGPSKSYMKGKGDEAPRPKIHLYFPIPFHSSPEKQERYMSLLQERFEEIGFDPAVKDAARCFFGHDGKDASLFWLQDGKPITTAFGGRPKGSGKPKIIPWRDLTVEELAQNPEIVPTGERYEIHKIISMHWANKGLDVDEIEAKLIEFNQGMPEPRAMNTRKVQMQTRKLAESAAAKVESEGGPNPDASFNKIRNFRVVKTEKGPVKVPIQATSDEMKIAMKSFVALKDKAGGRVLTLRDDPQVLITKSSELRDALESIGYVWDVRNVPGAMNKEDILVSFRNRSQSINRMTCVPEFPIEEGTLFVPQIHFPDPAENGALKEYLNTFSFKTEADQYRFAAGILSLYLPSSFDGKIPMFALLAEAQNAGKTTVVRSAVKMATGMEPIEQKGGKFNQADDHAQFSGALGLAARGVLYDNLMNLNTESETEIARAITDQYRTAWTMGVSRAHIRNSYVYFATFNDSEGFGRDLQERTIAVRMMDPSEVDRDKRDQIMDRLAYWSVRRESVIADIQALIRKVEPIGRDETSPMEKYPEWTRRIAPALRAMYPDVEVFDFSSRRDDHRVDPMVGFIIDTLQMIFVNLDHTQIFKNITGGYSVVFSATELFETFVNTSPQYMQRMNPRSFLGTIKSYKRDLGDFSMEIRNGTAGTERGKIMYEFTISDKTYSALKEGEKGVKNSFGY